MLHVDLRLPDIKGPGSLSQVEPGVSPDQLTPIIFGEIVDEESDVEERETAAIIGPHVCNGLTLDLDTTFEPPAAITLTARKVGGNDFRQPRVIDWNKSNKRIHPDLGLKILSSDELMAQFI